MKFQELNISEPILKGIEEKGYTDATPIQQQGIPVALSGSDMLGIAQTGTGKTAAFAIPIIQQLLLSKPNKTEIQDITSQDKPLRREHTGYNHGKQNSRHQIKALVLTPTRELALQISDCFTDYGKYTGLRHCVIFGGVNQCPQVDKLKKGTDILIATPGRLHDLINQGYIELKNIKHFVLDEADRMLDMGFICDIKRLLPMLPKERQTLFFSATMPKSIVALSKNMLINPKRIEVTPVSSAVDTIEQSIYFVERPEKKKLLVDLLLKEKSSSVLVFSRTKHGADNISKVLQKAGIKSETIHGNKSQSQRQRALANFKEGRIKVMVATDIAARGIDVDKLGIVINYDLPDVAETYVHRIGRTGRAGNNGRAFTFCSQEECSMVKDIQKLTGKRLETVTAV